MKILALACTMLLAAPLWAQEKISPGTILPVRLNSSVKSNTVRPGAPISGRIMQDVPQQAAKKIRAGSTVLGQIVAVNPHAGAGAEIALRFDTLVIGKRHIQITTNLRAMASMMDIDEAAVPETGPDRGTSEYYWTTEQIGGETVYHGGGDVTHGSYVVGKSVPDGVLVRASAPTGSKCRSEVANNDFPQAFWLFSSDACGLYSFPRLTLVHSGRTDPVGEIRLQSTEGPVNVRAGSGMLLRVLN